MRRLICGVVIIPILLLGPLILGCNRGLPPLKTEVTEAGVKIRFETLGEYPSAVSRVRLKNRTSNTVIWEVQKATNSPQMWRVTLRLGENPILPPGVTGSGSFEVIVPAAATSFSLEPGISYEITIWSADGHLSRTASFRL